jgi:hypothetical protein
MRRGEVGEIVSQVLLYSIGSDSRNLKDAAAGPAAAAASRRKSASTNNVARTTMALTPKIALNPLRLATNPKAGVRRSPAGHRRAWGPAGQEHCGGYRRARLWRDSLTARDGGTEGIVRM